MIAVANKQGLEVSEHVIKQIEVENSKSKNVEIENENSQKIGS